MPEDYRYLWPGMESPDGTETASGAAEWGRAEETLENFAEGDGATESRDAAFPGETGGGTPPFTFNGKGIRQRRVTLPSGNVPEDERLALHDSAVADLDTYTSAAYDAANDFANSGALDELRGLRRGSWNPFGWLASGHSPKDDPYTDAKGNYLYDPSGAFADPYGNRYLSKGQYQDMLGRRWRDIRQTANNDPWVLARRYLYAESADKLIADINDIQRPMYKVMTGGLGAAMPAFLYADGFDRTGWSNDAQTAQNNMSAAEYLLEGSRRIVESGPGLFMGMRQAAIDPDTYTLGMMNATVIRPAVKSLNRHLEGLGDGSRTDGLTNDEMILLQALAQSAEMNSFMQPLVTGTGVKGGKGIVDLIVSSLELWGAFEAAGAVVNPLIENALAKVFWRFATLDTERFTAGMRAFVERPDIFERLSPMQKEAVRRGGAEFLEEFGNEDMLKQICAFSGKSYKEVANDIWAHSYGAGFNPDEFMFERGGRTYGAKKTGRTDLPAGKGTRIEGDYIISEVPENQGLKMPHDEKVPLLSEEQMGKVVENKAYMENVKEAARPKTQIGDSGVEFMSEPKPEAGAALKGGKTGAAAAEEKAGTRGGAAGEGAKIKDVPPDDNIPPSSGGAAAEPEPEPEPEPEDFKSRFTSVSEDLFTTDGTGSTSKGRIVNVYDGDGTLVGTVVEDGTGERRVTYSRTVGDPIEEMQKRVISMVMDEWAEAQNVGIVGDPKAQAVAQKVNDLVERVKKTMDELNRGRKYRKEYLHHKIYYYPNIERDTPEKIQTTENPTIRVKALEAYKQKVKVESKVEEVNNKIIKIDEARNDFFKLSKQYNFALTTSYSLKNAIENPESSVKIYKLLNNLAKDLNFSKEELSDFYKQFNNLQNLYKNVHELWEQFKAQNDGLYDFDDIDSYNEAFNDYIHDELDQISKLKTEMNEKYVIPAQKKCDNIRVQKDDLYGVVEQLESEVEHERISTKSSFGMKVDKEATLPSSLIQKGFYINDEGVLVNRLVNDSSAEVHIHGSNGTTEHVTVESNPHLDENGLINFGTVVTGELQGAADRSSDFLMRKLDGLNVSSMAYATMGVPYVYDDADITTFKDTLANTLPESAGWMFNNKYDNQYHVAVLKDGRIVDLMSYDGPQSEIAQKIHVNLIENTPEGYVTGYHALEWIMNLYPQLWIEKLDEITSKIGVNAPSSEYFNELRKVVWPVTRDEMRKKMTGSTKPISEMSDAELAAAKQIANAKAVSDALDAPYYSDINKEKYTNRPYMLIYYADTPEAFKAIHDGMLMYHRKYFGEEYQTIPDLRGSGTYDNVVENANFLKELALPIAIADSPDKMQLLMEYLFGSIGMFSRVAGMDGANFAERATSGRTRDLSKDEKGKYVKKGISHNASGVNMINGIYNLNDAFHAFPGDFDENGAPYRNLTEHIITPEACEIILDARSPGEVVERLCGLFLDRMNDTPIKSEFLNWLTETHRDDLGRIVGISEKELSDKVKELLDRSIRINLLKSDEEELEYYNEFGKHYLAAIGDKYGSFLKPINVDYYKTYYNLISAVGRIFMMPYNHASNGSGILTPNPISNEQSGLLPDNAFFRFMNSIFASYNIEIAKEGSLIHELNEARDLYDSMRKDLNNLIITISKAEGLERYELRYKYQRLIDDITLGGVILGVLGLLTGFIAYIMHKTKPINLEIDDDVSENLMDQITTDEQTHSAQSESAVNELKSEMGKNKRAYGGMMSYNPYAVRP